MTFTVPVARMIPGMMALGSLGKAYSTVPKKWGPGMKKPKLMGPFVEIIGSTPMIGISATQVAAL